MLALRVPAQVGVDRLLVHLVRWRDDDRTMRRGLAVVQALIVDRDAEEAGRAERDVSGVLFLDRPADRLLALVDAEHELRARPLAGRLLRQHTTRGKRVEDAAAIGALVRFVQDLAALEVGTRQAFGPESGKRVIVERRDLFGRHGARPGHVPQQGRGQHRPQRSDRRHPRLQTRPVGVDAKRAACALDRAALEQQPHGQEVDERRRRSAAMVFGMPLEPGEHPGPARQRQRRGVRNGSTSSPRTPRAARWRG